VKSIRNMSLEELAAFVCQRLADVGITVTLTGGGCVAIWSEGKYVSHDLDFIEEGPVPRKKIAEVLSALGFSESGRHFIHADSTFFVEFPTGPLMVGDERVQRTSRRRTSAGTLRLLTPTDCVKDRLAAFFHWNDRQSLQQALLVANAQRINLSDIRRWSKIEQQEEKFRIFEQSLREQKSRNRRRPKR
jgi:hypothetical protein